MEETSLEQRLQVVKNDLTSSADDDDSIALEEQLRQLQTADRGPLALPSLEVARTFGDDLLLYVHEQQLNVLAFGKTQTVAAVGEKEYQAVRYAIATQGTAGSLVGLLKLLKEFPTAAVQQLTFVRPSDEIDNWEMTLELDLFYGDGEV